MARALGVLVIAAASAACVNTRFHRDTNAPGIIDVNRPPAQSSRGGVERPRDPGERMFTINPGIFSSAGAQLSRDDKFTVSSGAEISFNWGENPRSHYKDGFFVYPLTGYGVSLGWAGLQIRGDDAHMGPVYVEASKFRVFLGGSLGVAVNPDGFDTGAQASAWAGPYYVRVRYMLDGGAEIYGGMQIKVPLVWIWSR